MKNMRLSVHNIYFALNLFSPLFGRTDREDGSGSSNVRCTAISPRLPQINNISYAILAFTISNLTFNACRGNGKRQTNNDGFCGSQFPLANPAMDNQSNVGMWNSMVPTLSLSNGCTETLFHYPVLFESVHRNRYYR